MGLFGSSDTEEENSDLPDDVADGSEEVSDQSTETTEPEPSDEADDLPDDAESSVEEGDDETAEDGLNEESTDSHSDKPEDDHVDGQDDTESEVIETNGVEEGNDADESEVVEAEVEVVEEPEDLPTADFGVDEKLATFTSNFAAFSFKIIPQSTSSGLQWAIWVFANDVQGPLLQTTTPISKGEAEEFGLPEELRERINEALEFAQKELNLPSELRREVASRSLEDLERLMQES